MAGKAHRKEREAQKRARLYDQAERAKAKDLAAAAVSYDPRTASGKREFQVENLGGSKRARANPYKKLFRNPSEATYDRILACEKYDALWHAAHESQLPAPNFEPRVDTSTTGGTVNINAAIAHKELTALQRRIGQEADAIMCARVVMGMSYRGLQADGHGDERALSILFVSAADSTARFFGLKQESALVTRVKYVKRTA